MRLLSEVLPLRTTDVLGDYAETTPLPHQIGDLTASPTAAVRLSATEFLWADHQVQSVTNAYLAAQPISAWEATPKTLAGVSGTLVRLAAPAPEGAILTVAGKGRQSTATGRLLENCADVIEYGLALAGRSFAAPVLAAFRAECARNGLKIAGPINVLQSARAWIETWTASVGAVWTPSALALYPTAAPSTFRYTLDATNSSTPVLDADLKSAAASLRLSYAHNDGKNRDDGVVELAASGTLFTNAQTISAPWLRGSASAIAVCTRFLTRLASGVQPVTIDITVPPVNAGGWNVVKPCRWVYLNHPPITGAMFVLGREFAPGGRSARLTGELQGSLSPDIRLVAYSAATADTVDAAVEISGRPGFPTFTITDTDRRPLVGAQVSLDGGQPKLTDARGQVTFAAAAGLHRLDVALAGYYDFSLTVTVL